MSSLRMPLLRLFCICSAAAVIPLAPLAIATAGKQLRHPLDLEGSRIVKGSAAVTTSGVVIDAVRFGDTAWTTAGSPEARRRFRNVPGGTSIIYRLRGGQVIAGQVLTVAADEATITRRLTLAFLTLLFTVGGLALGLGGVNRAAASAGGFLAGLATTIGFPFLKPNVVHIASPALRDALIVAYALVPGALWCRYLMQFASEFPVALRIRPIEGLVIEGVSAAAIARAVLLAFSQTSFVFDRLPLAIGVSIVRLLESNLLQLVPYLATTAATLVFVLRQSRELRERQSGDDAGDRVRLVAWGCSIGIGVPLLAAMFQGASLLATHRLAMPREAMALLLLPLALVPLSLVYALLSRRVDRVGILARRAVVFAVAERTLLVLAIVPAAFLIALFYSHRGEPIGHLVAERAALVIVLAVLTAAALLFALPLRRRLAQAFFRDREVQPLMDRFPSLAGKAPDVAALGRALARHLDSALHVESIALFAHDRARGVLADAAGSLEPLDLSSRLARLAAGHGASFALDPRLVADLPEADRAWIGQRSFAMAAPLFSSGQQLLALVAVGEKMSGLPFDAGDRLLLDTAASSAALALENLQLRAEPAAIIKSADASAHALICETCGTIYDPLLPVRCAIDGTPLASAGIPHLLHGKFRFEQRLGRGAMGVVYRARDLVLGRDVAIKTLPTITAAAAERLEREARAVAALSHPSIATIHAWESWHGRPMLVFELLDGGTLAGRVERGPLAPPEVIRIGIAVADALAHAHAAGILHRDIKPSNIGFGRDDAVKVLDFGLARSHHETLSEGSLGIAGTPLYLSPEAILGDMPTPMVDVWATAVMLYEALTGRNPFLAETECLAMNAVLQADVADPGTLRNDVPPQLAALLLRALHRHPGRRIGDAAVLREALLDL